MTHPIQQILTALQSHGHEPKRSGEGWVCRCPAHDDRHPSLSIRAGDDGRALVHCHAGCAASDICDSIGLRLADLFAPDADGYRRAQRRTPRPVTVTETRRSFDGKRRFGDGDKVVFPSVDAALATLERRHGPASASWSYEDAGGVLVGLVLRWDATRISDDSDSKPSKTFVPISRTVDSSGWSIGGMASPRPLYSLPRLLATPGTVYITEGEKAADAAQAIGLRATTTPHGANSPHKADWLPLSGADVVVLVDNDEAGEKYGAAVARLAYDAGAKSVKIVRLVQLWAGMPKGGDIVDFLKHRNGDAEATRAEIETLADNSVAETPPVRSSDRPAVGVFRPFPVNVMPEPIRGFVSEAAKAIGCDASYIALPLLSGLASAIGNTHRIELKRGWTEPAILWTAIVGESGTMKTPAFKLAMKAIRTAQADAFKEYEAAQTEWQVQHLRYEAELANWKRQAGKKHREAADPPERPAPPVARRYIVSDTTTEALAPILLSNPRGVLLARDELSGWLGSFDRYAKAGKAGVDSAHWLSMHGGEAMTIDRKTAIPPTIHVPSASVCITGGIQPGILARALGREHHESGMAARMLYAMPPRKAKRWSEADVNADTEAAVARVFDRLYAIAPERDEDGVESPRVVTLNDEGKRAWVTFYNEHAVEQQSLTGDLSAAWSKLEGYAARLALVFHLTRWAAGDAALRDPSRIDEESITAGVMLARWFGDEARRVYAGLAQGNEGGRLQQLVEWLQNHPGPLTARDVSKRNRTYREDADGAEADLNALVERGIGTWMADEASARGGRPTRRFQLADGSSVTETRLHPETAGGFGDGDSITTERKP